MTSHARPGATQLGGIVKPSRCEGERRRLTRNSTARRRFSETSISTPRPPPLVRRAIGSPKRNGPVRRSDTRQRRSGKRLTRLSAAAFALALYRRPPQQLYRLDLQHVASL